MENRRSRRFSLCLPLSVTRTVSGRTPRGGFTRNISSVGVLFVDEQEPELGGPIEYVITLNADEARSVHVRCMGTVVRCQREGSGSPFPYEVAATLERYEFLRPE